MSWVFHAGVCFGAHCVGALLVLHAVWIMLASVLLVVGGAEVGFCGSFCLVVVRVDVDAAARRGRLRGRNCVRGARVARMQWYRCMMVVERMLDGMDVADHNQDGLNGVDEFGVPWQGIQLLLSGLSAA